MTFAIEQTFALGLLMAGMRLAGMMMVAPVFAHAAVPVRLRVAMAIVMAAAVVTQIAPAQSVVLEQSLTLAGLIAGAAMEFAVGLAVGYAASLLFAGVEMAAGYVAQQVGIGLIEALNPTAEQEASSIRHLYMLLAVVIFVGIGGHRDLVAGLLGTFDAAPVLTGEGSRSVLAMVTSLLMASFTLALKLAWPVLVTAILLTVALGVIQRTAPQLNILSAGLPAQVMLGLVVLAVAIGLLGRMVNSAWDVFAREIFKVM